MPNPAANPLADLSTSVAGLVAQAAPAIVSVRSRRHASSGFVWKPGLVITADEALAEDGEIGITLAGGARALATIVGRDPSTDVALISTEANIGPGLALDPVAPAAGALALVLGAHDGAAVAALGIVARAGPAWRSMRGGDVDLGIDLDLSLRRSSEGGLALDAQGRAFGMAVFGPRGRVLVIPTATIVRVAVQLEAHGRVPRGYLGLGLRPVRLDGAGRGRGAMVMSVDPAGPGSASGFRQGDVISAFDGQPVGSIGHLLRALGPGSVGRTVPLSVVRGGETRQMSLTIAERPGA